MQANGETNPDACAYNDFALVRLDPADVPNVNPSVPGFGGPTGVGSVGGLGSNVYSYGNSSLRAGVTKLSPKQGVIVANEGNGWSHNAYTLTPGIPGDSGSGFMNDSGQAIGVLSTVELLPRAGSNNFGGHLEGDRLHAREQLDRREPRARHGAVQPRLGTGDPGRVAHALASKD
jgi:hypothetical protein